MKELSIEARLKNLDTVQSFVAEELGLSGCSLKQQMQISVAVEEIFVNIVSYAYKPAFGGATIRVWADQDVCIEFEDSGKPYNPLETKTPDITKGAIEREIGGLGVFMVKSVMDTLEYKYVDGKNVLLMRKKLA